MVYYHLSLYGGGVAVEDNILARLPRGMFVGPSTRRGRDQSQAPASSAFNMRKGKEAHVGGYIKWNYNVHKLDQSDWTKLQQHKGNCQWDHGKKENQLRMKIIGCIHLKEKKRSSKVTFILKKINISLNKKNLLNTSKIAIDHSKCRNKSTIYKV